MKLVDIQTLTNAPIPNKDYLDDFINISGDTIQGLVIGFKFGYECLSMLQSNELLHLTIIDPCHTNHVLQCWDSLRNAFPDRLQLLIGDTIDLCNLLSTQKNKFDLVIMSNVEDERHTNINFFQSRQMIDTGAYIVYGNIDTPIFKNLWNGYVKDKFVEIRPYSKATCHLYGWIKAI